MIVAVVALTFVLASLVASFVPFLLDLFVLSLSNLFFKRLFEIG